MKQSIQVLENIKKCCGFSTDEELAKGLNVAPSTLRGWIHRNKIPYKECVDIAKANNISLDVLILNKKTNELNINTKGIDTVAVPFYDNVSVSAGGEVALNEGITDNLPFNKLWLEQKIGISKGLTAFPIKGDSMHPTYKAEDTVICAVTNGDFNGDAIYIINLDGDVMIKRLAKSPQGTLHIISDNVKYPNFEINLTDENINLKIIALVKMAVVLN